MRPAREIDVIEEVARHHGYSRLPRRRPAWPQVGGLTGPPARAATGPRRCWPASGPPRRGRRTFVPERRPRPASAARAARRVAGGQPAGRRRDGAAPRLLPGTAAGRGLQRRPPAGGGRGCSRWARSSPTPTRPAGWPGAGTDGRQAGARRAGAGRRSPGRSTATTPAGGGGLAALAEALRPGRGRLDQPRARAGAGSPAGLHPTRAGRGLVAGPRGHGGRRRWGRSTRPCSPPSAWTARGRPAGGLAGGGPRPSCSTRGPAGAAETRPGRSVASPRPTWTWPSWWPTRCRPATVAGDARGRPGARCSSRWSSSTSTGARGLATGRRSLAFRLRFCALDRTLTDAEVGELRAGCIAAVAERHGATLRG